MGSYTVKLAVFDHCRSSIHRTSLKLLGWGTHTYVARVFLVHHTSAAPASHLHREQAGLSRGTPHVPRFLLVVKNRRSFVTSCTV